MKDFEISVRGNKYYPQLFIPFYNEIKDLKSEPILVLNLGEGQGKYIGYSLNEQNELVELPFLIDEEYAKKNEVWVISINERRNIGKVVNNKNSIIGPDDFGGASNYLPNVDAFIENMAIYELKESFIGGKPEVYMTRYSSYFAESGSTTPIYWVGSPTNGSLMHEFDRSDLSKTVSIYQDYYPQWSPDGGNSTGAYGDILTYLIYEYDSWPAPQNTLQYPVENQQCLKGYLQYCNGRLITLDYRSSNSPYDYGNIYYPYEVSPPLAPYVHSANNYTVTRSESKSGQIAWNSKTQ